MLEIKNICFTRNNKKILDHVSLNIDLGKFVAITGPNGSGKSSLVKIIMGIEKPDSGSIIFEGKDITNMSVNERAKLGISFAFQQPIKFKGITVYDLLQISAGKKLSWKEACDILSKVGLCAKEYLNREVDDFLSGGELKRIELSTAVLRNSKLTIFDEPEAGIDLWSFQNLINIFEGIRNDNVSSTLVISHQERILKIADEIILMKDGIVKSIGKNFNELNESEKNVCCKLEGEQ